MYRWRGEVKSGHTQGLLLRSITQGEDGDPHLAVIPEIAVEDDPHHLRREEAVVVDATIHGNGG